MNSKNALIWFIPAFLLIVTLAPVSLPTYYLPVLKIVVSVAAFYILFLLMNERPKYYLLWSVGFVLVIVVFNPIYVLSFMKKETHFAIDAAMFFVANWLFAFKPKTDNPENK